MGAKRLKIKKIKQFGLKKNLMIIEKKSFVKNNESY